MKVLENTPAVLSLGKLCDENGYSYEWINGQKPHLILKRYSDTMQQGELHSDRRSSSFPSSTSMTSSRQEIDHPGSSSSSSTSPTTTKPSDSETGAREDLSDIDSHPVSVSSEHVERTDPFTKPTKNPKPIKNEDPDQERRDPLCSEIPGMAARIQRKCRG